jgi:hypothetical protein
MSLVVLAYPKFSKSDYEWVQNHRKKYDKLYYEVVEPHYTIVFPIYSVAEDIFIEEVLSKCKNEKTINFIIRSAVINKDLFIDTYHEFLVPDEGHSLIIKLHDKIYSEKLFPELRMDIDFIPHIGIGNSNDPLKCKYNVDRINRSNIELHGIIDNLNIARYKKNKIETIKKINLE